MAPTPPRSEAPRQSRGAPRFRSPNVAGGTRGCGDGPASPGAPCEPSARRSVVQVLARALRYGRAERGRRMGGPAGAGLLHQATEKAMTTNVQSNHTKNELLRELVIVIAFLAMLLSGVGALYWMQTRPEEAAAGTAVAAAGKPADAKQLDAPRPKVTGP